MLDAQKTMKPAGLTSDNRSVNEQTDKLIAMTKHSNPMLQDKIQNFQRLKQFNNTMQRSEEQAQTNYLTQTYLQGVKNEQERYRSLVAEKEGTVILEEGSFFNSCTLMVNKPYLTDFAFKFNPNRPPVIGSITRQ